MPEIYVSTDVEADGPIPGPNSMLSFGSAIMAPEVYLKALAMVRNVARQEGRSIARFTTAVFDICPIHGDIHSELQKTDPGYYFRPHKTILFRTVADVFQLPHDVVGEISNGASRKRRQSRHGCGTVRAQQLLQHFENISILRRALPPA